MRIRRAIAACSVTALTLLGTAATAPAAHAGGYGCLGSLSWSGNVLAMDGSSAGTVKTYWDGTTNCSVFVKSTYSGTKTYNYLWIMSNDATNYSGTSDEGYFSSYAGPVTVKAVGRCVREYIQEKDPSGNLLVNYWTDWHSCG